MGIFFAALVAVGGTADGVSSLMPMCPPFVKGD